VFLPPLPTATRFCDIVQSIDETAADLDLDVEIEGYPPPSSYAAPAQEQGQPVSFQEFPPGCVDTGSYGLVLPCDYRPPFVWWLQHRGG